MEFPQAGKQCGFANCKQLDFLPFTCEHCQLTFCKEHYLPDGHACAHVSPGIVVEGHAMYYSCTFDGCTVQTPIEMCCPACKKHFCLQHRHHGCIDEDQATRERKLKKWQVPKEQFKVAKEEADRQVKESLKRAMKKEGLNKTAIKVQLMKMKASAVGTRTIPRDNRLYFLYHPPQCLGQKARPVYVDKNWSVGRVIDSVAALCNVTNRNKEPGAPKLRLFHLSDGQMVCPEMDKPFGDAVTDGTLTHGEALILEYVDDCKLSTFCIENVEKYMD